jgi:hypothetical protein
MITRVDMVIKKGDLGVYLCLSVCLSVSPQVMMSVCVWLCGEWDRKKSKEFDSIAGVAHVLCV